MALTWNGKRFDWLNVAYFTGIHLGALFAPFAFSWSALGLFFLLYWLSASVGICLTYHRLLTHRGFKVPKPLEYLLTFAGMLASEGGAICLPGYRPLVMPSRAGRLYPFGLHQVNGFTLFVSRGVGGSLLPIRTYAPPDVAVFAIR